MWDLSQITTELSDFKKLPAEVSKEDLEAVAGAKLPNATARVKARLAQYAASTRRWMRGLDAAIDRGKTLARRAGRSSVTGADIEKAIVELLPAATAWLKEIESAGWNGCGKRSSQVPSEDEQGCEVSIDRETAPLRPAVHASELETVS